MILKEYKQESLENTFYFHFFYVIYFLLYIIILEKWFDIDEEIAQKNGNNKQFIMILKVKTISLA